MGFQRFCDRSTWCFSSPGHGRTEQQFDEHSDYWPQAYQQWPVGLHGHNSEDWHYIKTSQGSGNDPCENEGGVEFTLARGAYAIIGMGTCSNTGGGCAVESYDRDIYGNEQTMYPSDFRLNSGGGSIAMDPSVPSCGQ